MLTIHINANNNEPNCAPDYSIHEKVVEKGIRQHFKKEINSTHNDYPASKDFPTIPNIIYVFVFLHNPTLAPL